MASVAALAGIAIPTNNTATIMATPRASRLESITLLLCGGVDVRSGTRGGRHFGRDLCFLNGGEATRDAPPAMVRAMSGPRVARDRASIGHDLAASKPVSTKLHARSKTFEGSDRERILSRSDLIRKWKGG